jgi:hypothetical protein
VNPFQTGALALGASWDAVADPGALGPTPEIRLSLPWRSMCSLTVASVESALRASPTTARQVSARSMSTSATGLVWQSGGCEVCPKRVQVGGDDLLGLLRQRLAVCSQLPQERRTYLELDPPDLWAMLCRVIAALLPQLTDRRVWILDPPGASCSKAARRRGAVHRCTDWTVSDRAGGCGSVPRATRVCGRAL